MTIIWRYIVLFIFLSVKKKEGVQKVFGTLDLFVSLLETEIKYPILQGGILPFWTPSYDQFIFRFDFRLYTPLRSVAKDHENNNIQEM